MRTGNLGRIGAVDRDRALRDIGGAQTAKEVKGPTPLVAVPNEGTGEADRRSTRSRAAGPGARLHPVPDRKPAHPAGVWERGPDGIAASWTPALLRGRPVVADRRHER